jgi:hypothetical protein
MHRQGGAARQWPVVETRRGEVATRRSGLGPSRCVLSLSVSRAPRRTNGCRAPSVALLDLPHPAVPCFPLPTRPPAAQFFRYFWEYNVFLFTIIGFTGLTAIYLSIFPSDRDHLNKVRASRRRSSVPPLVHTATEKGRHTAAAHKGGAGRSRALPCARVRGHTRHPTLVLVFSFSSR